jgi:hypothetical protein
MEGIARRKIVLPATTTPTQPKTASQGDSSLHSEGCSGVIACWVVSIQSNSAAGSRKFLLFSPLHDYTYGILASHLGSFAFFPDYLQSQFRPPKDVFAGSFSETRSPKHVKEETQIVISIFRDVPSNCRSKANYF